MSYLRFDSANDKRRKWMEKSANRKSYRKTRRQQNIDLHFVFCCGTARFLANFRFNSMCSCVFVYAVAVTQKRNETRKLFTNSFAQNAKFVSQLFLRSANESVERQINEKEEDRWRWRWKRRIFLHSFLFHRFPSLLNRRSSFQHSFFFSLLLFPLALHKNRSNFVSFVLYLFLSFGLSSSSSCSWDVRLVLANNSRLVFAHSIR